MKCQLCLLSLSVCQQTLHDIPCCIHKGQVTRTSEAGCSLLHTESLGPEDKTQRTVVCKGPGSPCILVVWEHVSQGTCLLGPCLLQDSLSATPRQLVRRHTTSTINAAEVQKFSELSANWWDPTGPMWTLHKINPVRVK